MNLIDEISLFFSGFSGLYKSATENVDNWESVLKSSKKSLKGNQLLLLGKAIYEAKLKKAVSDLHLTNSEKGSLEKIISHFSLKPSDVKLIKQKFNRQAVKKLVEHQYRDKILTDEEKEEIFEFAAYLELSPTETESIRKSVALNLLYTAMNSAAADRRLTPDEEEELNEVVSNLKLPKDFQEAGVSFKALKQLAFYKTLWQFEQGIFNPIPNENISLNLKKGEECYLCFPAKLLEQKTMVTHYSGSSSGISVRVAKGVSFRVGSNRSVPIRETFTLSHAGNLFLTDQRIVFSSSKGFVIPHDKLITFQVFKDGIGFEATKNFLLQFDSEQVELFALGLSSVLRKRFED